MLQSLENNINALVAAYETQKNRADVLEKELQSVRASEEEARNKVKELEEKVDSLSLRSVFTNTSGENTEAKRKVQMLIEQIDKALELLK